MTDQEHIANLEDRVIKQEDVLERVLVCLRMASEHASRYITSNLLGEKDPMLAGMKHALEIIERWNAKEPETDPLCESQDVDLDRHEADSPPWTRIDPDSIKALMTKLDETEQQLTEARALLQDAIVAPPQSAGTRYLADWSRHWRKQADAFLARTTPKQLDKAKETE